MDQNQIEEGARQFRKLYTPDELRLMIAQAVLAIQQQGETFQVYAVELTDFEDADGSGLTGLALSLDGAKAAAQADLDGNEIEDRPQLAWEDETYGSYAGYDDMFGYRISYGPIRL